MPISVRVKVTVPKEIFNSQAAVARIKSVMQTKTGPDLRTAFRLTTLTWFQQPDFSVDYNFSSFSLSTQVYASGEYADKYALVNNGSPAHIIRPRQSGFLRFQTGYTAKSKPRMIASYVGGKSGNFVSALEVSHPGFEAREFDVTIAESYQNIFVQDMQDAMKP